MAERKRKKKKKAAAESRGLAAKQVGALEAPPAVKKVADTIADDGGTVLAVYRDPLGGNWQILAALPLEKVEPTPYQRDLSETHVQRLAQAIDKTASTGRPTATTDSGRCGCSAPSRSPRSSCQKRR